MWGKRYKGRINTPAQQKTKITKATFRFSYFSPNDDKLCLKVTLFCVVLTNQCCALPSTEARVALQFPQLRQFEALCEEAGPSQAGKRRAGLLHFASVCPPCLQERQNNRHAFSKFPPFAGQIYFQLDVCCLQWRRVCAEKVF